MSTQQGPYWGHLENVGDFERSPLTSCRSGENRIMMTKVYIFLIFMVLILPSLGLTRYTSLPPALISESGLHLESTVPMNIEMVWDWMQISNNI